MLRTCSARLAANWYGLPNLLPKYFACSRHLQFEYQHDTSLLWGSIHVQTELDNERVQDEEWLSCRPDRSEYALKGITSPYDALPELSSDADRTAQPHVQAM